MRLLIYGMQSSGASTLAFLLGQKPDCAAFVDVWAMYAAPSLPEPDGVVSDVVAKVVVTTTFPLELHQERFRPDKTILLVRHPEANHRSLSSKAYRHHCGFMEEKFRLLDAVFRHGKGIDAILRYEDFIFDPLAILAEVTRLGWQCDPAFLRLHRSHRDIRSCNERRFPSLTDRLEYGMGNWHAGPLSRDFVNLPESAASVGEVRQWCPMLVDDYQRLIDVSGVSWSSIPGSDAERQA